MSRNEALVLIGLALGTAVSNGFARFAYGLILPAMQADLGWSYTEAGWINTANSLGYLAGALLTLPLIARVSQGRLFVLGFVGCALSILATGLTRDFAWASLWRVASGVFGAPVFITAGALAAALGATPRESARNIALTFGGGGLSLVFAGALLPGFLDGAGAARWPTAWVALGVLSLALLPLVLRAARGASPRAVPPVRGRVPLALRPLAPALLAYFLFATGYIVYLTFLAAWMRDLGEGPAMVSATWAIVGLGTFLSGALWRGAIGRAEAGGAIAATLACIALGTLVPVIWPSPAGLLASATVFGLSVFMCPTAVTQFVQRALPAPARGRGMALMTVVFATGQTLGPVAAGAIGDAFGSIAPGLAAAALILGLGALAGLAQRPVHPG